MSDVKLPVGLDNDGNIITDTYNISGQDNRAQARVTSATNQWNYALSQYQNQWNREQWNLENEYNSPANQLSLYEQAGLNPLMYMGNLDSTASNLNSANMATGQSPQLNTQDTNQKIQALLSGVNLLNDGVQKYYQNKALNAQAQQMQAQTNLTNEQSNKTGAETSLINSQVKWFDEITGANVAKTKADTAAIREQANVYHATIKQIEKSVEKMNADIDVAKQSGLLLTKQNESYWKHFEKQMKNLDAQNISLFEAAGLSRANAEKASAEMYQWYMSGSSNGCPPTVLDMQKAIMQNQLKLGDADLQSKNTYNAHQPYLLKAEVANAAASAYNNFIDGTTSAIQSFVTGGTNFMAGDKVHNYNYSGTVNQTWTRPAE